MGTAIDYPTSLVEPEECDFWLVDEGANPTSPYDSSDEWTYRFSEWRCVLQWTVLRWADAMAIEGFFAQARGRAVELNIPNFKLTGTVGTKTGTVTPGTASAGATSFSISGGSGAFAIGDVVKFPNLTHDRLHYVIGGNGTSSIVINPPLWFPLTGGSLLKHRGDGTATNAMRETMLLASPLQGGRLFPSPGSDTTGGYITSRAIELVSSKRVAA